MPSLTFFVPTNRRNKKGGPAPLDGLNELVNAERISTHVGNSLKRRNGLNAQASCLYAMKEQGWECPRCKCRVTLTFHEPSTRRDPDNIYGGAKFILDGIIKQRGKKRFGAGAIEDDSQRWIELCFGGIVVDKENVGCEVVIETMEEE